MNTRPAPKNSRGIIHIIPLLVVAILLPLLVWALWSQNFDIRRKAQSLPSFPGAEGFGSGTPGGRGGTVMEVTNLNDGGDGSFRSCAEADTPRICVFRIGGTIETQSMISIKNPFITIAGQTAPGGGITLKASPNYLKGPLAIKTHDVIIRYIRVRAGKSTNLSSERRGITVEAGANNIILDHVSISWATDDNLTLIDGVTNMTVQWSIISEALSNSTHSEGEHSKGLAISGKKYASTAETGNISVHHSLLAHNKDRNPRNAGFGLVDFVNNLVYNWKDNAFESVDNQAKVPSNIVGNFFKKGQNTGSSYEVLYDPQGTGFGVSFYVNGNLGPHRQDNGQPEENIVHPDSRSQIVSTRFDAPSVTTTDASTAYEDVLTKAGSRFPYIDRVDERVINEVRSGTGFIIDDPLQVDGWPTLDAGVAPQDTDHDGMPDSWEQERGLNPNQNDSTGDRDGDGYTNIEEYINSLVGGISIPLPSGSPTPITTPTPTPAPTQATIPPQTTDNESPVVSITNPSEGAIVPRNKTTTITADASDNVAVSKLEFRVNNSLVCSDSTSPYSCNWRVRGKRGIQYAISAKAIDTSNNSSSVSINVISSQ